MSGRPFALLGVNNDGKISRVKKAIKENKLNWRSWYDGKGGPIVKQFKIRSFPTIFLVDHTGIIRYKNLRGKKLDTAIEKLVAEAEAAGMTGGSEPSPKLREFQDATGKYKTNASYVGFDEGMVVLKKEDESETKVPWSKLSLADQRYVARYRLKKSELHKAADAAGKFNFDELDTFTDKTGEHSIEGTYIALKNGKAIIWKKDGTETSVSFIDLSEDTKDLIKKEIKRLK